MFPQKAQRACELLDCCRSRGLNLLALNLQFCMREQRIASTLVAAASPAEILPLARKWAALDPAEQAAIVG